MNGSADGESRIVEHLSEQLSTLNMMVEQLSQRLAILEDSAFIPPKPENNRASMAGSVPRTRDDSDQAGLIDTEALLPRISTICFLLVIALILRTITDNHIINTSIGSLLGMSYAALLIISGWRLYGQKSRLAPVFPGCGILLLFSIVLETHARYQSLPTIGAYSILFLSGAFMFAMSLRYQASYLICLGVAGTAMVGIAIDFPYPVYPILGSLLLSAIIAASYAFKQLMCRYLRWITLVFSAIFWLLWSSKMNTVPSCAEPSSEIMYPSWFFTMLFLFWGVYLATVLLNVLKKDLRLGYFESLLPTLTAAGAFGAGHTVISAWFGDGTWFYITLIFIATGHLGLAWWLAQHDREKAAGSNVFTLAGATLIVLVSATLIKNIALVLPVWSASACVLALLSCKWGNAGMRVTSYVLQLTACTAAVTANVIAVPPSTPVISGFSTAALTLFSILQYRWSRIHRPVPTYSLFFSKIDRHDFSAVILLLSGLLIGFYFSKLALYEILSRGMSQFSFAFQSGQSLVINSGAMLLMYIALKGKNKEIITVATGVALIGGIKVFILDLFGIKGMPLVLSVFSSGLVAAFGSVVMNRWQKTIQKKT